MPESIKIAIPMAGLGTRMRPHTWSKPKPLIALAGGTVLDHVLEQFNTLPGLEHAEYIFIIGPNQRQQIEEYMQHTHPDLRVHYVVQETMRGQSDALYLAREFLHGPMLMTFSDTLIETDLAFLNDPGCDAIAWVKPVPDPRRFGVAQVGADGWVQRLVEKPQDLSNNLAVVGFYYFHQAEALMAAFEEQFARKIMLKNEFFLTDAVNIMLERGARMRTNQIDVWMDAGIPEALLETNRYLLEHGHDNSAAAARPGVAIIPPVFIHPSARIEHSVIGPHVSLGEDCELKQVVVRNSIFDEGSRVEHMVIEGSLLGRYVQIQGQSMRLNLGDQSWAMS